jgi:hypothetical protein
MSNLKTVGAKIPRQQQEQLRYLAFAGGDGTTVSSIIAGYIDAGLEGEDLSGYYAWARQRDRDQQARERAGKATS